ncbi:MAG: mechanosensitive ion channel family protein [Chlamydiota bacterium]
MESKFWFVKILFALVVLVAINYAIKFSLKYAKRKLSVKDPSWKGNLEDIIYFPTHVALWIVGVAYTLEVLGCQFQLCVAPAALTNFRNALIVACLMWILLKWKREFQSLCASKVVDTQMIFIFGRIVSIIIVVLGSMMILQLLGLDIMPLIAFGGIGAAAIGFASKDVIANFCSGVMIYITRPFIVGEWILLPDRKVEAIIEEIGWYMTAVRDKEKRPIYLPNAIFSQQLVINSSRMSHRRILENISVRYDDFSKVKLLAEEIKKKVASHPRIDTHLPLLVFFNAFKEYSLDIHIDIYTIATRYEEYLAVKQEVLLSIYDTILAHGAAMPFPTRTILMPD